MGKHAIVSMKTTSAKGIEIFRPLLAELQSVSKILALSSVYRVDRFAENFTMMSEPDGNWGAEGFIVVAKVNITSDLAAFVRMVAKMDTPNVSLNLLAVEGECIKTPTLTLPFPELHNRAEELIPASEVWPDMVHPLLKVPLRHLALSLPSKPWGDFHCQGQVLLDKESL